MVLKKQCFDPRDYDVKATIGVKCEPSESVQSYQPGDRSQKDNHHNI